MGVVGEHAGDHHVYYPGEDGPLHRSSHVLINDKSDAATDCAHVTDLYRALANVTGAAYGRTLRQLELARSKFGGSDRSLLGVGRVRLVLTPSVGERLSVGFTAGNDDHKGRPGAARLECTVD